MGARALALVERFEQINEEMIAFVDRCSDADWQTPCPAEGQSVGVVAYHVAAGYLPEIDCIRAFATGQPLPPQYRDWALMDRINAQHAAEHANCTKAETLQLLRRNGAAVTTFIRELGDAQLDHTAFFALMGETRTTRRMIERILLGHPEEHLASIRAAVALEATR